MTASPGPKHHPLDRLLNLFTVVRDGESTSALLLTLNVFLLLAAYYMIKPVREALILSVQGGAEIKSYLAGGQAILLLLLVPAYGALADRLPRRKLLNAVTGFFVACLVAFFLLTKANVQVGIPFFLWVGIFNLMIVAQFWSFANDLYTKDQGERLFPIVGFGASLGAAVGSVITRGLIPLIGVPQLLLVAGGSLVLAVTLSNLVDRRERRRCEAGIPARFTTEKLPAATGEYQIQGPANQEMLTVSFSGTPGRKGTFRLVFASRYLLTIAVMILVLNWVNTTGEYILGKTVKHVAENAVAAGTAGGLSVEEYVGEFYSDLNFAVSVLGLVLQLFVVSRLLKYLSVRWAVLLAPLFSLGGYVAVALVPILAVVRWVKTTENATDYSLQNTLRNVLFLPTSREEKYKAKQAIDSFFVRFGDVLSAGLVYAGSTWLSLGVTGFARVNVVLALIWAGLAFLVGQGYLRKTVGA
jgi:AAA family ATP:ADP antiporter